MQSHPRDPFITGQWGGHPVGAVTAADRLSMVQSFSVEEIDQALAMKHLQKTVIAALQRRRRQLIREHNQQQETQQS